MARKHHNEEEVLMSLRKKKDIRISGSTIFLLKNKIWDEKSEGLIVNPAKVNDLGNGSWGKIDFLQKKCGYNVVFTDQFKK